MLRHEIRKSGGEVCEKCGSHEMLKVVGHHEELAREIAVNIGEVPRWRFLKRRWAQKVENDFRASVEELTNLTRFDFE